jgi:hypothetical protein
VPVHDSRTQSNNKFPGAVLFSEIRGEFFKLYSVKENKNEISPTVSEKQSGTE